MRLGDGSGCVLLGLGQNAGTLLLALTLGLGDDVSGFALGSGQAIGVRLGVVDDVLRVAGLRQLVEVPVRTNESHVLGRGGVLLVELLEIGVHRETYVFKPLVERHVLAGVARAGTRSSVAEVVADRGAKDVHLGHARERKRVALVLEQRDSLGLDLLGNVARGLACPLDLRRLHVWPGGERGHQVKVRRDHNPHGKRHRNH